MEKKEWYEPELIVLVRSKPEEAVLSVCKAYTSPSGPANNAAMCAQVACEDCAFIVDT
jgi:hypothetical protein